jgi:hypothetical protein
VSDVAELLLDVLREPRSSLKLSARQWRDLVSIARRTQLLARISVMLDERELTDELAPSIQIQLRESQLIVEQQHAASRAEMSRVAWVLRHVDTPIVALKGAAYVVGEHRAAMGRRCNDVDVLVSPESLDAVEDKLLNGGWAFDEIDDANATYYRKWLQELPPMIHRQRGSILDVHHSLLPRIDRKLIPTEALLRERVEVAASGVCTLSPRDMVLHSALHMFQMRDIEDSLRDVGDIDLLLREFSREPGFWSQLLERAAQFEIGRCLFYAIELCRQWYDTPIPEAVLGDMQRWKPNGITLALTKFLVRASCAPRWLHCPDSRQQLALAALTSTSVPRVAVLFDPLYWKKRLPHAS